MTDTAPRAALPIATSTPADASLPAVASLDLVGAFLAGRKATTLRAYARDLADFARFAGFPDPGPAVELLIGGSAGEGNALALGYRAHLTRRGLAPATIARRLAALRSMVRLARTLGRIDWSLEIQSPKSEPYRDTAGPGDEGWRAVLSLAKADASSGDHRALRDLAIVRLLHDLGLRRGELVARDRADVELDSSPPKLTILGKGRSERERLTLPSPAARALADWIAARGDHPGPLFNRLDRARPETESGEKSRLTDRAVYDLVARLGSRAGLRRRLRPHGLRHQAITSALDRSGGNLRAAARFSRHRDLRTLSRYDDNREDLAGRMAALVSDE